MTKCYNCKEELKKQFEFKKDEPHYQFDNALWIAFHSGYGMYVEDDGNANILKETGASYEAVVCHDCADLMCEAFPFMKELLDPDQAHSHTAEYWAKNPDHVGWD